MKRLQGVGFAWVVCGLLLGACGSIEPETYAETLDEALCHRQARCGEVRDEEACVRDQNAWNRSLREAGMDFFALYEGSLAAGRARLDAERAEECLELIRDSACEKSLEEVTSVEACKVLVGQRKEGESCHANEDCDDPAYFCTAEVDAPVCTAGVCKRPPGASEEPPAVEGESCEDNRPCALGLFCDPNVEQCRRPGIVGVSCGPTERPCLSHLRCFEGSCRQLANVGMSCTVTRNGGLTWTSDCKKDLFCDAEPEGTRGTCKVRLDAGSECFDRSECKLGLFCGQRAGQQSRTCQAPVGEGEKCDTAGCALGLACHPETFTCVRRGNEGEACPMTNSLLSDTCLPGLACMEGTCQVDFPGLCGEP